MTWFNRAKIIDEYGFGAECTPMDELRVVESTRLVGTIFNNGVKDTAFWTEIIANNGSVVQANAQVTLNTNVTSANGSAIYHSNRTARYVAGSANRFRGQIQLGNTGAVDNSRVWGMANPTFSDGAYFELDGTTLYCVTRKTNTPTRVASTSWNGVQTVPTLTNVNTYEIYQTNGKVYFVIAGEIAHTVNALTTTWTDNMNLNVYLRSTNSNSLQTNNTLIARVASIHRLGKLETNPTYFHGTVAATTVLKQGAGYFHRLTLNNPSGTLITIYDNTSATGTVIAVINTPAQANPVTLEYNLPFNTGLTVVTTGTFDYTLVYE